MEEPAPDPLVGQLLDGRYRIDALLGTGAMGAVYRGVHVGLKRAVAVKVLHPIMTLNEEVVLRFEREAVAAARVEHPNVAKAMDFGKLEDGRHYLALEFAEGQSLRRLIEEGGPIATARAVAIVRQIASGLAAAHAMGVVHRDLKPDNVMLVGESPEVVKVLDFGIAKLSAEDLEGQPALTRAGTVFGTPEYMAPEQAKGLAVDARADLYSLGVMLYEMLVGQSPFAHDDLVVVLTRQITEPPPPLPPGADPALGALAFRLLEKEPDLRIQTASELVAALDAFTVSPSPPSALTLDVSPSSAGARASVAASTLPAASIHIRAAVDSLVSERTQAEVRKLLVRTVEITGRPVPVWALGSAAVGALALLVVVSVFGAVLIGGGGDEPESPLTSASASAGSGAPVASSASTGAADETAKLVLLATKGDKAALDALSARPEAERSAEVWYALGRGYLTGGRFERGVAAYERAVRASPKLAEDAALLADLYRTAAEPAHAELALRVASRLGARGADLVHAVATTGASKEVQKIARGLLATEDVRGRASPALSVALDLSAAKSCGDYKKLLERAAQHADERSSRVLVSLTTRSGCGLFRWGDCFSCLRGSEDLDKAVRAAKARRKPTFEKGG